MPGQGAKMNEKKRSETLTQWLQTKPILIEVMTDNKL